MEKKYIESIGRAYQQVQEKLKGDQHKLDHDKDGDIDGNDFAAMRAKKKMKKEDNIPDDCVKCPKCEGKGCDHCDDKGYHKKDEMEEDKAVRKEDEEVIMNPKKKKEKGAKPEGDAQMAQEAYGAHIIKAAKMYMKDSSCSYSQAAEKYGCSAEEVKKCTREMMKKENTQWPIYQRIMEKNAVNQHAVPPEKLAPTDVEGDHISKAAAEWIKDHEGNETPEDYVDINKVVGKNKMDALRTVPGAAKDEVNKKAKGAEAQPKANKEA